MHTHEKKRIAQTELARRIWTLSYGKILINIENLYNPIISESWKILVYHFNDL